MSNKKAKKQITIKDTKLPFDVLVEGSLGLLALGAVGIIEWKKIKNAAIRINQNYFSKAAPSEIKYTTYRNIFVENMTCDKAEYAIQIMGIEDHPIENVKIVNCTFNNIEKENLIEAGNDLILDNTIINTKYIKPTAQIN